jgi:hypothetical protein
MIQVVLVLWNAYKLKVELDFTGQIGVPLDLNQAAAIGRYPRFPEAPVQCLIIKTMTCSHSFRLRMIYHKDNNKLMTVNIIRV